MMMINRRRVYGGGKSLPYDAEIEYLESSGTQYIDTGIRIHNPFVIRSEFTIVDAYHTNYGIWGTSSSSSTNRLGELALVWNRLNFVVFYPRSSQTNNSDITLGNTQIFFQRNYTTITSENGVINGVDAIYKVYEQYESTKTLLLFALNRQTAGDIGKVQFHKFQLEMDDTLILDLIPVRIGNVGYMYDKVSKQLFGNAGTGNFILGPDK